MKEGFEWLVNTIVGLEDANPHIDSMKNVLDAVERGDNKAKTQLAWYLLSGRGGAEVDFRKALMLLEERVNDNDKEAMWMLGMCYEYGFGCEPDIAKAETLYKRSSDGGNSAGQFLSLLGQNNVRGSGVLNASDFCL